MSPLINIIFAVIAASLYMAIGLHLADRFQEIGRELAAMGAPVIHLNEYEYYAFVVLWPILITFGLLLSLFAKPPNPGG